MNDQAHRVRTGLLAIQAGVLLSLAGCTEAPRAVPPAVAPAVAPVADHNVASPPETASPATPAVADAATTESPAVQFIRMLDRDGDGRVSREEHAIRTTGTFDSMDGDHDGKVTVTEMDALRSQLQGEDRTPTADEIAKVDKDRDGMLSSDEHTLATRVEFDRADIDHDGFLTLAELEASEAGAQ